VSPETPVIGVTMPGGLRCTDDIDELILVLVDVDVPLELFSGSSPSIDILMRK